MSKDLFRDTPLRYLGYANEVGEAFRALLPARAVWFTYGVACAYVGCDAADKSFSEFNKASSGSGDDEERRRRRRSLSAACDALVWQSLATVIVPGLTINRLCWLSRLMLYKAFRLPYNSSKYISVAVGLAAIPFIVKPIDNAVDHCLDLTLRPWLHGTDE